VINNPQLKARGYFLEVEDPESGKPYVFPGAPVKMGRSPWLISPVVPRTGEYNDKIYREELGLNELEIEEFTRLGVM